MHFTRLLRYWSQELNVLHSLLREASKFKSCKTWDMDIPTQTLIFASQFKQYFTVRIRHSISFPKLCTLNELCEREFCLLSSSHKICVLRGPSCKTCVVTNKSGKFGCEFIIVQTCTSYRNIFQISFKLLRFSQIPYRWHLRLQVLSFYVCKWVRHCWGDGNQDDLIETLHK